MKTYTLEELTDRHIGRLGTAQREVFENELRIDLLGCAIKRARKERNLTQEQLGEMVGVKKAQISKVENGTTDARLSTFLKVFTALDLSVKFNVEFEGAKGQDAHLPEQGGQQGRLPRALRFYQ